MEQISGVTVWRWLCGQTRSSPGSSAPVIFARDSLFKEKAGPILDLYQGCWQGERLHPDDYVVCADEKPSIQARARKHRPLGADPSAAPPTTTTSNSYATKNARSSNMPNARTK